MKVVTDIKDDIAIVSIEGEIERDEFEELIDAFTVLFLKKIRKIIVDMGKVSYIDSAGIAQIISIQTKLKDSSSRMIFANLKDMVKKLFEILRLEEIFEITPTMGEAIKKMEGK